MQSGDIQPQMHAEKNASLVKYLNIMNKTGQNGFDFYCPHVLLILDNM